MAQSTPPLTPVGSETYFPRRSISASKINTHLPTPPYTPERPTTSPLSENLKRLSFEELSRPLSENELSYYLPSRADGVNDMCVWLHAKKQGADWLQVPSPPPHCPFSPHDKGTSPSPLGIPTPPSPLTRLPLAAHHI